MKLKLTDDFLNKYHIKDKSSYNNNYYELPFGIICDGYCYCILCIRHDEYSNEDEYSLCYELDGCIDSDRYIIPSCVEDYYVLDLNNYSKEMYC